MATLPVTNAAGQYLSTVAAHGAASPPQLAPARLVNGRVRVFRGCVEVPADAEAGAEVLVGTFPADLGILPQSLLTADASMTVELGDKTYPSALIAAGDPNTAGGVSATDAVAIGQRAQPLWQMLGYATRPAGDIDLILCLTAPAEGVIAFDWMVTDE